VPLTDAEVAVAAVEAGSAVVRARYGSRLTRFEKSRTDFATEVDVEAELAIREALRAACPSDGFVGEETGRVGSTSSARVWLVDPLCGTANYAAHTPLVAVNVALRSGDATVAAATADPLTGEVFWTDGDGAYLRRDGADAPLQPSAESGLIDLNVDLPHPNGDRFKVAQLLMSAAFPETLRPRVLSTTLALAWVASGRRAGYVTDGNLEDNVHFAAGLALCQSSGAVVTGLLGQPLHTGVAGLIAAADEPTHAALVAAIADQFQCTVANRGYPCSPPQPGGSDDK
jgi:myo-inositol-1(or 4)-monophosphatase